MTTIAQKHIDTICRGVVGSLTIIKYATTDERDAIRERIYDAAKGSSVEVRTHDHNGCLLVTRTG
jgi:hypothetical protein